MRFAKELKEKDTREQRQTQNNYEQCILLLLNVIRKSAEDAAHTFDEMTALHKANILAIESLGRSKYYVRMVFDYWESNPIVDIGKTATALRLLCNTVLSAVHRLIDSGILVQTGNAGRNRIFAYEDYFGF